MSAQNLLIPGGNPIGSPGGTKKNRQNIREVPGGQSAAYDLFDHLTKGGIPNTPAGYPGTGTDLPGGG